MNILPGAEKKKSLLMIGSHDACRMNGMELLGDRYRVIPAIDGHEGLAAFLTEDVEGIILDYNVSKINGIELLGKIRKVNSHIPVYIICDVITVEELERCIGLGIDGFFRRPFEFIELANKVDRDLSSSNYSGNIKKVLTIPLPANITGMNPNVRIALRYIHENYYRSISKIDILDQLNISSEYFSRVFKKECGVSIPQYIGSLRIQKAKELLANTTMSVSEIVKMTGFHSENYFYILFKHHTGMSPAKFRKTH